MEHGWITRQGTVVHEHGLIEIRFQPGCGAATSACAGCPSSGGAGGARRLPATHLSFSDSLQADDLRPGESITMAVRPASLTRVALVCFAAPLAALLAGAWLRESLAGRVGVDPDTAGATAGLGALVLVWLSITRNGPALLRMLKLNAWRIGS